jgi:hypothetical protein
VDIFDPNPDLVLSGGYSGTVASFVLDLTDDGFNPATEDLYSAYFDLKIKDYDGAFESGRILVTTAEQSLGVFDAAGNQLLHFIIPDYIIDPSIQGDGATPFKVYAMEGNFTLEYATLTGYAGSAAVPEPGTVMLLGSGLVGLVLWGRKKIRK